MASLLARLYERGVRLAPGRLSAALDGLRPGLADGFGGPFNGQERRMEAVKAIFGAVNFEAIVETGTYRGTTTLHLRQLTTAPIATIELNSRYYHYSARRLREVQGIRLIRGDSPTVLRSLAGHPLLAKSPAFFYLDAHWLEDLPLLMELQVINSQWHDFVVVVDDFQVPGDPGYAYDDYGPGKVLEPTLLTSLADVALSVFWPSASSSSETGARRGWIVLATSGPTTDALAALPCLRYGGTVGDERRRAATSGDERRRAATE